MFQPADTNASFPQQELDILRFWKAQRIYEKSLALRRGAPRFVFYEGPPTANGLPHPGHCLTRAIKDLFPRYRTMRGYLCERKGGWDTHGLPVEVEVCKELGIHSKEEIERYGVEPFIHRCQESVFRYIRQWEQLTERLGFWIDLSQSYVTYHQSYVESVWWSLKNLFDRGLLYQGHKIVWWWAQGGTALSSGEVGQGYRQVADPSVYVFCPLVDAPEQSLLVWTTTPWTLPSNQFVAVHPFLDYCLVEDAVAGRQFWIAADLRGTIGEKVGRELTVLATRRGSELEGLRYRPPFDDYYRRLGEATGTLRDGGRQHQAWRVVLADFVTVESGTGLVHQAPAFGEVDFDVLQVEQARFVPGEGPELICAVAPDGTFTDEFSLGAGRWVKDCDKDICRELKARGLMYHQEQYVHEYPFCWRAEEDPLIQYPRQSWFIRTKKIKERMLENNRQIHWLPEHIRDGRFGNFLQTNVDWALSRERFWGTPLPIWVCEQTGRMEAVGSYAELLARPGIRGAEQWEAAKAANPSLPDDLKVHKPYIDAVTYDSPFAAGARMRRVPEVIDCWYDSGAMPFAQWGYPHAPESAARLAEQFPADFISEAIDQTRGWFYSLLAISTLMFFRAEDADRAAASNGGPPPPHRGEPVAAADARDARTMAAALAEQHVAFPHPFRNCIVLGLMLGEDGGKMSKSKRNYREPGEIFDRYGADALRWYFFANQPPWTSIRYSERAIKEAIPEFLLRLWNCYTFFVIYANIDGFEPENRIAGQVGQLTPDQLARGRGYRPVRERSELDRWVLSELSRTEALVVQRMDAYDNYAACAALHAFVDGLSNWYVRRSRDRFWAGDKENPDKLDAYWTLYECLITAAKLIAPFVPFLAEKIWQNLAGVFGDRAVESVHLCDYPAGDGLVVDALLGERMRLVREISSLGRAARMEAKLNVRQPLEKVEVILVDASHLPWLQQHAAIVADELNVKQVAFSQDAQQYITYLVQPNFKRLGPRLGPMINQVKAALAASDGGALLAQLKSAGRVTLSVEGRQVELDGDDVQVRLQAKPGWAAAEGDLCVVVLSTEVTPPLLREGLAREVVRKIQERRKQLDCAFTDRIRLGVAADAPELRLAIEENAGYIKDQTLAVELVEGPLAGCEAVSLAVKEHTLTLYLAVVTPEA